MNPVAAVQHALEAEDCRAAARMLADMGLRKDALPLLALADKHDRAAKEALDGNQGPDLHLYTLPKGGRGYWTCPKCGERAVEYIPKDEDVGIKFPSMGCDCGYWQKIVIDERGGE